MQKENRMKITGSEETHFLCFVFCCCILVRHENVWHFFLFSFQGRGWKIQLFFSKYHSKEGRILGVKSSHFSYKKKLFAIIFCMDFFSRPPYHNQRIPYLTSRFYRENVRPRPLLIIGTVSLSRQIFCMASLVFVLFFL